MHGEIFRARELNPEHTCLYEGDSERFLSAVAPWLFNLEQASAFAQWIAENGSMQSWGVLLRCPEDPVQLYKHLRNFLIVESDDGREMYFRYYDPRVLRVFLPTCEREQLHAFFGPIDAFVAEDADGQVLEYSLNEEGALHVDETGMTLGQYIGVTARPEPLPSSARMTDEPEGNWDFGY